MKNKLITVMAAILLMLSSTSFANYFGTETYTGTEWEISRGELMEIGEYIEVYNRETDLSSEMQIMDIETINGNIIILELYSVLDDEIITIEFEP